MRSRLAAWLLTGPVGHGWAGVADIATVLAAVVRQRLRRRLPERLRGGSPPAPRP